MANYVIKNNSSLSEIIKQLGYMEPNQDLRIQTGVLIIILKAVQQEIINSK